MSGQSFDPECVDVLLVDDDDALRRSLRRLLERAGYTCAEAGGGPQAVWCARRRLPQCVFLDLAMPDGDGLAVARRLRADPGTRRAHIHCLSRHADQAVRREARQAGCELFLTKPVEAPTLLDVVHSQVVRAPMAWVRNLTRAQAEELLARVEPDGCALLDQSDGSRESFAVRLPWPMRLRGA